MAQLLSDKLVKALERPAEGNHVTYDDTVRGFGVRITAAGARAFILNYRAGGRERRLTIGAYPDWSVAAAREEAKRLKRGVDQGNDPMGERHAERGAPTVKDMAARYVEEYLPRKDSRSQKNDLAILRNDILPRLGAMKVANVRRADADALHRHVTKRAPIRANRVLAVLSKLFNQAIIWDWRSDNPCRGVERNPENRRTRYLSQAEIARLSEALAEYPNQIAANAVRLAILTGARSGEIMVAKWSEFDLEHGVWTKPSHHTKQRSEHRIPLSAAALELLAGMADQAKPGQEFAFPGRNSREHIKQLRSCWHWVSKRAELKDARLHDCRHTFASLLASAGVSLHMVGALLGHTQPQTTHRYAHLYDEPLREATERVGAVVTAAGEGSDVVPIRKDQVS